MKRSEMVKMMVDAYVCYQENENIKDLEKLMDKVLLTCEQEGMNPPRLLPPDEAEKPSHPEYKGSLENVWEPEDE